MRAFTVDDMSRETNAVKAIMEEYGAREGMAAHGLDMQLVFDVIGNEDEPDNMLGLEMPGSFISGLLVGIRLGRLPDAG